MPFLMVYVRRSRFKFPDCYHLSMKHIGIILLCIFVLASCKTTSPFKIRPNNPPATEKTVEQVYSEQIVEIEPELRIEETPAAIEEAKDLFVSAEDVVIPEQIDEVEEQLPFVLLTSEDFTEEPQEIVIYEPIAEDNEITVADEAEQAEPVFEQSEVELPMDNPMGNTMVASPTETKTVLQTIEDAIKGEGESKEAVVAGNVLPMWFVYTFAFLFLSCLFTLCYLSKNRRWRRIHGD